MHNTSHTFASAIRPAMLSLLLLGAASTPSIAAPAQTDVVVNGSFEVGPGVSNVLVLAEGSTALAGWTVVEGDIDYVGTYWQAGHASASLDLNASNSAGGVTQLIPTVVGKWYQVRFRMSGNPAGGDVVKLMHVNAGTAFDTFAFDTTGINLGDMGWVEETIWFQANNTLSEILFTSGNQPSAFGPALDYVRAFEYDFRLQAESSVSGNQVTVCALGASPTSQVLLAYSFAGPGPLPTPFGNLLVSRPYSKLSLPTTDANGDVCQSVNVPPTVFGRTVWLHAFDTSAKTFSNGMSLVLGP